MKTIHELSAAFCCPVDAAVDVYQITVETSHMIKVEDIIAAVRSQQKKPVFQEDLTARLSGIISASVTTIGFHSGVKTTCSVSLLSPASA